MNPIPTPYPALNLFILTVVLVFVLSVYISGLSGSGRKTPTNNPGTATAPEDEHLKVLRSIDKRLAEIEKCVRDSRSGRALRTAHWNDRETF